MNTSQSLNRRVFQVLGICSPYIAVLAGVFLLKNAFLAVLFYHAVLLTSIIAINRSKVWRLLIKGYHGCLGPMICVGGLLPGVVIIYLWAFAKAEHVNLSEVFSALNLDGNMFTFFVFYSCLINPFLEESFWRGCFNNRSLLPSGVDALFAGYHALAVLLVLNFPFVILLFLALTFVGWLFRSLYNLTDGLLIPLMTHIIADVAILYAIWRIMQ